MIRYGQRPWTQAVRGFFKRWRMSQKTRDLTEGSIKGVLLGFAAPLFLSQLFQQLYNSADALIVGNFLGKEALAAVSSSGPLIHLFIGFFNGAATGAGVVISRHFGAQDRAGVRKAIHTNVLFSLLCGLFLSVTGVLLTPYILRWMGTDPAVLPQSEAYFRWYFAFAAAIVMYNALKGIMTALGDSRRPLYYLIVSSVLNVILDLLFVGVLHGGVNAARQMDAVAHHQKLHRVVGLQNDTLALIQPLLLQQGGHTRHHLPQGGVIHRAVGGDQRRLVGLREAVVVNALNNGTHRATPLKQAVTRILDYRR